MKIFSFLLLTTISSFAATSSITFWAYDRLAGSSPYYTHFQVTNTDPYTTIMSVDHYDNGWGFNPSGSSSAHVMNSIDNIFVNSGVLRSVGWHKYEMNFNDITMSGSLLVDGNTLRTGSYSNSPTTFRFSFHDYFGGTQETVMDDFEYRMNGVLVYSQDFESSDLGSGWTITRQDSGTYVTSGDTTTPRAGVGSLALGATAGGQLFSAVAFDLTSVPEPSSALLSLSAILALSLRRRRAQE